MRIPQLLQKIEDSDISSVSELIKSGIVEEDQAWEIHLALFPVAQRVLNPPFINPHLPKMYRICREFLPYLRKNEIPALVRLEINEYTRRPKLKELPNTSSGSFPISFPQIETAIREEDKEKTAILLKTFLEQEGKQELARNLLLLGSGYLDRSLGHSLSCTAFILLEMIERPDQDAWPTLVALAEYFCSGRFHTTPDLQRNTDMMSEENLNQHLLRATSGNGIINLHHTITRYSIESIRHLLNEAEYDHMLTRWVDFMGYKTARVQPLDSSSDKETDYESFSQYLRKREEKPAFSLLVGMISSKEGRQQIGHHLIKGVCDLYRGEYDPHFLTGLGSALWVVDHYRDQPLIAANALHQYLNYYLA